MYKRQLLNLVGSPDSVETTYLFPQTTGTPTPVVVLSFGCLDPSIFDLLEIPSSFTLDGVVLLFPPVLPIGTLPGKDGLKIPISLAPLPDPQGSDKYTFGGDLYPTPGLIKSTPIIDPAALIIGLAKAPIPPPPETEIDGGPQATGAVLHEPPPPPLLDPTALILETTLDRSV